MDERAATKRLKLDTIDQDNVLVCERCSLRYDSSQSAASKTKCPSCNVNTRRFEKKVLAIEYKGGKCAICGYNKCNMALTFHHIDPSTKEFEISGAHCLSWDRLKAELDKCVMLCHNCHAEFHAVFEV
jgi:hypothetical protein